MRKKIQVGALAGLFAGVLFGLLMELLPAPGPAGSRISMALLAARAVHAHGGLAGWLTYLVYGVIIGGFFGCLLHLAHAGSLEEAPAIVWGGVYGIGWWIVAGLVVLPGLLGSPPFSSSALAVVRPVALALLAGHLLYGILLGAAFSVMDQRRTGLAA